ncbi:Acetyltransferase [Burkholderiales bacterium 8X]|nr:Acetyltransferase [Burkholderiales bacterium 8X]
MQDEPVSIRHLERLLSPASVAVFGASERPGSVGATVWRNLLDGRFSGRLDAVNPKHEWLLGMRCYPDARHLPGPPDLAVLCTPPRTIPGVIAELAERGTRAAIIVTAGLDADQKQAALDAARPTLMRLLGPNCIGVLSPHLGLNASFAHVDALPGHLAFVSQSGALVTAVLDRARSRGIGLSHMVSLGEHCDVDFGDLLDYLANDPRTRAILLYVESITAPRKFMSAARAAARNKPVIVVKAGRAGNGVLAAASHTGALAGSDRVYDAAIRRAGMLRVDTLQQLFTAAETLARFGGNRDEVLTLMTNGGGAGVMAADAAARAGVKLAELEPSLIEELDALLPSNWSRANPIDIVGDAPVARYTGTLAALLARPSTGAILFMHAPTAIVASTDIARACVPMLVDPTSRDARNPRVMSAWLGDASVAQARTIFEGAGIADYETPEEAVDAFAMLQTYRANQAQLTEVPGSIGAVAPDPQAARAVFDRVLREGRSWLDEAEVREVLSAFGVPVAPGVSTGASPSAAIEAARRLGYPVVLKIRSRDINHKSDVGGVVVDIADDAAMERAAARMLDNVRTARPGAVLDGFTVQKMVRRPHAREVIVGASIDPVFGPVLLFGQGGTAVEVVADTAVGLPPLNRPLARALVARTRMARLLEAWRDQPAADALALQDALVAVSCMLAELPHLAELDINPLLVDECGVLALDARIRASPQPVAGATRFAILPYPAEWQRELAWQDRSLVLRPVRPEDGPQHRRFVESLEADDVRLRFFQTRRELPPSEMARLTQIDYDREMAFIAEAPGADGQPEMLGVARSIADPDGIEAEFALLVRSDLKGQGLGTLLFRLMIEHAKARGYQRLWAVTMHENQRMLRLAHAMGCTARIDRSDPALRTLTLDLQPA